MYLFLKTLEKRAVSKKRESSSTFCFTATDGTAVPGGWAGLLCCHETPPECQFGSNVTRKLRSGTQMLIIPSDKHHHYIIQTENTNKPGAQKVKEAKFESPGA